MRKIVFLFMTIVFLSVSAATNDSKQVKQLKNDIAAAKAAIKNAVDMEKGDNASKAKLTALEKSENTIRGYVSQQKLRDNKDLHLLLIELLWKQYEVGNNKMYLKQQIDTAWFVKTGRRMFAALETFDSIDAQPNSKGELQPSYRNRHCDQFSPYLDNIRLGGLYFVNHSDWQEAWQSFDLYLDSRNQPLFKQAQRDTTQYAATSYMALLAAKNLGDLEKAKKYADEAVRNMQRRESALMMLADLCNQKEDTAGYVKYLHEGFASFPQSEFFFPRLIDYYSAKEDYATAGRYADQALAVDSTNMFFMLAKHGVLMSLGQYDEALRYAYRLQQRGDKRAILDYNIAYIYYQKAQQAMKQTGKPYRARVDEAKKYYRTLLPYMERYRKSEPDDKQQWYPVLYDAYLNLNIGKQFNELR